MMKHQVSSIFSES